MATQLEPSLDLREQIARIDKTLEEISKTRVEVRKIAAEVEFLPRAMIFQAMLATAALLGAGAAITKLFFP
ncbi:hypothetical protein KX816_16705 [Sphingosinicellaceae bacterium]|nr:hypothetical protein KX816_16705 [Sphingosinicellaceae bacterium]